MASLKSDSRGFLVGELIDNSRDVLAIQTAGLPVWRDIRRDVRSIARAMGVRVSAARRADRSVTQPRDPVSGRFVAGTSERKASGGRGRASSTGQPPSQQPASPPGRRGATSTAAATVAAGIRDTRGRFTRGGGGGGASLGDSPSGGFASSSMAALANRIGNLTVALQPAEGVDPAVNAVKEVADVVTPLGRGLFSMFGRSAERKKERWYSRFLKALTARKTDAPQMASGGGGRLFGGLLPSMGDLLPFLGKVFTRVLGPIAALVGSWELGKWIGTKIHEWLVSSGLQEKLFDGIDWVRNTASEAWTSVAQKAGAAWSTVTDSFTSAMKWLGELPGKLDAAISKLPVIGKAYTETKGVVSQVGAGFTEGQGKKPTGPDAGGPVQAAARAVGAAAGKVAGGTSNAARLLMAGRAAGLSGFELANFMGQNAHESGGFTRLNENLNYSAAGLRKTFGKYYKTDAAARADAGNAEAIANRVYGGRIGNTEAGDGFKFRGRGFTQLTGKSNYAAAGKALGLDLANNPDLAADPEIAARISAWYFKNRVSAKGAGGDVMAATRAVNGGLNGLADRQKKVAEWQSRLSAPAPSPSGVASVGTQRLAAANIPVPSVANLPPPPDVQEPPKRLNASAPSKPVVVKLPDGLGQNVGDRSLAHIVTGGIGGG